MTKIKEFREKERHTMNLLVKNVLKGVTQKGAPYLSLVLQDDTGTIDGKLWDASPQDIASAVPGHVEQLTFEVLDYNNALQLRINSIRDLDQNDVDLSEFVMASPVEIGELKQRIAGYIRSLQNETLKKLVTRMYEKAGKTFFDYPAASRIHHNYLGGLAEHTLGMADLAEHIASQYPILDRDLLIAGVLVHDMGKIAELGGLVGCAGYSDFSDNVQYDVFRHNVFVEFACDFHPDGFRNHEPGFSGRPNHCKISCSHTG